jgi:Site-specific recombinase XerD
MNKNDHNNSHSEKQKSLLTLEHLREYLLECDLPTPEIALLRSAIKRVDEIIGHGLLDVAANQRVIFERLGHVSPAMAGMSDQSFANLKSRLRKAFRLARGRLFNPRSRYPLTGDWGALQASLDTKMQRATSRLFHFASGQGVLPRHMSDAVIERFETHLRDEAMIGNWLGTLRGSIKAWNKVAASHDDLPQLTPPEPKRTSYWIDQAEWPSTLVAELDTFLASLASTSCFEANSHKALKPGTIQQYRYNVTILISALVHTGTPSSTLTHLSNVVRPEHVDQVLRFLHERASGTITPQMFQLALRARTIGRWCGLPNNELARLDQIFKSVRDQREHRRGMTAKNRALLDKLDDQRFADQLQLLPFILLERAMKNPDRRGSAALARTAMAIELLLVCSVRRANLVGLELGKSIRKIGHGKDAFWIIEHDGAEVKNNEDLRFRLPDQTVALLETYLRDWRPKLCPDPSPWLFPAADGNCIDPKTMAYAIGAQSKRVLGVAVTPHQFRHISAELYLKDNPEGIFTVSQHLGHRDINTTRHYYARPKQRQASRHFQEHILRSRDTARIRVRRSVKPRKAVDCSFNEVEDVL